MGERRKDALQVDFDRSVKLDFHGSTISSDGGFFAYRQLDEAFALTAMADDVLTDLRMGSNIQYSLAALLRHGNVASAHDWCLVLVPVIARYRALDITQLFRGDDAFSISELYEFLETEGYRYAIRLPANTVLYREIDHLMKRPVSRPPAQPIVCLHYFHYRAAGWDKSRTVVAKVEWHRDELFPRVGFIVTNMRGGPSQSSTSTIVAVERSSR